MPGARETNSTNKKLTIEGNAPFIMRTTLNSSSTPRRWNNNNWFIIGIVIAFGVMGVGWCHSVVPSVDKTEESYSDHKIQRMAEIMDSGQCSVAPDQCKTEAALGDAISTDKFLEKLKSYALDSWDSENGEFLKSPAGVFPEAAVTTDAKMCSEIATKILVKGGSAVDAAIAAELCLGLYVPQSMGVGGGFFMTIYDRKSSRAYVIDAREMAPAAATDDMFHGNTKHSQKGTISVAVPGVFRGLKLAHEAFGKLAWKDLFAPTIELCIDGVQVERSLAHALKLSKTMILADKGLRETFADADNEVYGLGDTIRYPKLAETLETISANGVEAFYDGEIGRGLVIELQEDNGNLMIDDLRNYTALFKNAIETKLKGGLRMYGPPPPASGVILSHIMLVLDGYNISRQDVATNESSILLHHRIIEAFKFANARRSELGDETFVNQEELIAQLTSPKYAKYIRSKIKDDRTFPPSYYGDILGQVNDHGTSHLSVVSREGDAVALTSTINEFFGSGIMSKSSGIILNDQMVDFSSPDITNPFGMPHSINNYIVPGKRPVSSMAPTIFVDENDDVILVTGAAGGSLIPTGVAYTAIRRLWLDESVRKSVDARRIRHQLHPPGISYERGMPQAIIDGLAKKNHTMLQVSSAAMVNPIGRTSDGQWEACADIRRGGGVNGF